MPAMSGAEMPVVPEKEKDRPREAKGNWAARHCALADDFYDVHESTEVNTGFITCIVDSYKKTKALTKHKEGDRSAVMNGTMAMSGTVSQLLYMFAFLENVDSISKEIFGQLLTLLCDLFTEAVLIYGISNYDCFWHLQRELLENHT